MDEFLKELETLANASYENSENIVQLVEKMVPTFHSVGAKPGLSQTRRAGRGQAMEQTGEYAEEQAMDEAAATLRDVVLE